MDFFTVVIVLLIFIAFAVLDDDQDEELGPLDLARPSVERLHAEARRAAEELRALDHEERRR